MAKVTSSSNRSKRSSTKPVTKGQNPQRANRQQVSQAKVTSATNGKPTGSASARVTTGRGGASSGPTKADAQKWQSYQQSARTSGNGPVKGAPGTKGAPTNARPVVRTATSNVASARMRSVLRGAKAARSAAQMAKIAGAARVAGPVGAAAAVLRARPTAAGTVTAAQSGRAPSRFANARDVAFKKASAIKGSPVVGPKKSSAAQFDSAFAAARKAGKSTFTWRGKKYTTKMK